MQPDFSKFPDGLIPAVVQDAGTRAVLMLGYMNAEALEATQSTGRVTFYSRSKQRLWTKGETSGHFLNVLDIRLDCDNDALLIKATPAGPVCHTGTDTCWNEKNETSSFLRTLEAVIQSRKGAAPESSYRQAYTPPACLKWPKKWAKKPWKPLLKPSAAPMSAC
jgi:phosphoribosyl-ATP pyrophosphohydrolase/phosphoribosyl-AMP cyclohydrolase